MKGKTQARISPVLNDHYLALSARIDEQYKGFGDRLDTVRKLILYGQMGSKTFSLSTK